MPPLVLTLPDLVLDWFREVQSIGVDLEGAKHLFSFCEKRNFTPVQNRIRLLPTVLLDYSMISHVIIF
jgi:hypothetical protein